MVGDAGFEPATSTVCKRHEICIANSINYLQAGFEHRLLKPDKLPGIMATDVPEMWGRSKHRLWFTGHKHTKSVSEFPGVVVESFRAIAPNEAYANKAGYRTKSGMEALNFTSRMG